MNTNMWESSFVKENVFKLRGRCKIIMPRVGKLACGTTGIGAMADISEIVSRMTDS